MSKLNIQMNIIGISGVHQNVAFKARELPGLSKRQYRINQGFDSAAALVAGGAVVAAAAEERFTREKATGDFPVQAIQYCLQAGNIKIDEVDFLAHGFAYEPFASAFQEPEYARKQYQELYSPEVQKRHLKHYFPGVDWERKFIAVPHHLAHAASAFYLSGFEESLILVSDGMGEVHSMTVAVGQGTDIKILKQVPAFHSLGILYGVFTLYLGFYMNMDEYKVMGLAPYGNPRRYFDKVMELVNLKNDGTYIVPAFAQDKTLIEKETHEGVLRLLTDRFGPPRDPDGEITQHHQDIAAALQAVLQACQLHVARHFKAETGQRNLCLAGGVALNCSLNGVLRRSRIFNNMFVQPAAGDDGCALGAALYAGKLQDTGFKPRKMALPLWGPEYGENEVRRALDDREDCRWTKADSFEELCRQVAERLAAGEVVAWFQGRMEYGPRALGSRSILADPRDPGMRDRINSLVKKREGFRPFAPVVTSEGARQYFDIAPGDEETFAHMLYVTQVLPAYRQKLPAVTHVDGSARVQTVSEEHNPRLWTLLKAFERITGLPIVLNTSFNVKGEPIVCTPREALNTFSNAHLDALVLGDHLVEPKRTVRSRREKELEAVAASAVLSRMVSRPLIAGLEIIKLRIMNSLDQQMTYWQRQLSEPPPPPNLPWDKEAPPVCSFVRETVSTKIHPDIWRGVQGLAAQASTTPHVVLLAALKTLLFRYTAQTDLIVGTLLGRDSKPRRHDLVALRTRLTGDDAAQDFVLQIAASVREAAEHLDVPFRTVVEMLGRQPGARDEALFNVALIFLEADGSPATLSRPVASDCAEHLIACALVVRACEADNGLALSWEYDAELLEAPTVERLAGHLASLLAGMAGTPSAPLERLVLLTAAEERQLLVEWNATATELPKVHCIHHLIEARAEKTPDAVAVICRNGQLTYEELNTRANQVASHLSKLGVGTEGLVGLCVDRSLEMVVGLLGILKAGGAYLPLDPVYPAERLAFMIEDAHVCALLTQARLEAALPATEVPKARLDADWPLIGTEPGHNVERGVTPRHLAYVIYTSGSTGRPKGVMVEHGNVLNFFVGMDARIPHGPGATWLAVTSPSFDISVLELFWTLARGFKVVLYAGDEAALPVSPSGTARARGPMDFSLFYFSSDQSDGPGGPYRLLTEGARFADERGFVAVWTPERHFHEFGALYPNPSVTSAALAMITQRIQIRSGSVVAPLHSPIRIAEEWSVVDNLSNGRVAISFASGWMPEDFTLIPANYGNRKEIMFQHLDVVRRLWRGERVSMPGPLGKEVQVKIYPRPVQKELPLWLTAAGNPETFQMAGSQGMNLLTHLLGQSLEEVSKKVALYRQAWQEAGHTGRGHVTLMLHTFVGEDLESVKAAVREPLIEYLRKSADLIKGYAWAFSAFKHRAASKEDVDFSTLPKEEMDALLEHSFERYFETSGLFGTPESCLQIIAKLRAHDIDEVACLIDFGVSSDVVLDNLKHLDSLRQRTSNVAADEPSDYSIPALIQRHDVTHLQCTPTMAGMLLLDERTQNAFGRLQTLMIGGEAFPVTLAKQLRRIVKGHIINMYGPTETTIWSSTYEVLPEPARVPVGRPIANTQMYVLDSNLLPVPVGIAGELMIGGAGVARGYLGRSELTAARFIHNQFRGNGERLYRTGDLARYLPDGNIELLGRMDHQVKIRGHRVELGEIEALLNEHYTMREAWLS